MIILHSSNLLFLYFLAPCVVFFLNVKEENIFFNISRLSLVFNNFFYCSLYFFDSVIVFKFFKLFHYFSK